MGLNIFIGVLSSSALTLRSQLPSKNREGLDISTLLRSFASLRIEVYILKYLSLNTTMLSDRRSFGSPNGAREIASKDKGKKRVPELDDDLWETIVRNKVKAINFKLVDEDNDLLEIVGMESVGDVSESSAAKRSQRDLIANIGKLLRSNDTPPPSRGPKNVNHGSILRSSGRLYCDSISIQKLSEMILQPDGLCEEDVLAEELSKWLNDEAAVELEAKLGMNKDPSPEYEIFDISAYSPTTSTDKIESRKKPSKKKVISGAIVGELPTKKAKNAKGNKMNKPKPQQLASVMWERFHPIKKYAWPSAKSFH
ncbi:hypothetical protein C2S52_013498 [Perilla frutescens var. hirtella]|nr:hypothetical protein C2S52_013498 [Perilla frutescens var. hirtella]